MTASAASKTTSGSPSSSSSSTGTGKKRHSAKTHRTNTYAALCTVKFVYADDTKEPLRNRYVAYWVYDSTGKALDAHAEAPDWKTRGLFQTLGVSKTDSDGYLVPGYHRLDFGYQLEQNVEIGLCAKRSSAAVGTGLSTTYFSGDAFPYGKKVGFMVLPLDVLYEFETGNLAKLKASDGAWIGTINQNDQQIALPCTLPEWVHRIKWQAGNVKYYQAKFAEYAKQHFEAVSKLDLVISATQHAIRFPAQSVPDSEMRKAAGLAKKASEFRKSISEKFINNPGSNTDCGKLIGNVTDAAQKLWALVKNKEFLKELDRYLSHPKDMIPHNPAFKSEKGWQDVHTVIAKAYDILSQTTLCEEVYEKDVKLLIDYLASKHPEAHPDWDAEPGTLMFELKTADPVTVAPSKVTASAILKIVDKYTTLIPAIGATFPGPPSMVEAIINIFGLVIAKKLIPVKKKDLPQARLFRALIGYLSMMKGETLKGSEIKEFASLITEKKLKEGKFKLTEFTEENVAKRFGSFKMNCFQGGMFMFSLITFASVMTDDEEWTIKKWASMVSATSTVAFAVAQVFFSKALEADRLVKTLTGIKIGTRVLGAVGGLAATVVSIEDIIEKREKHDNLGMTLAVSSGMGSLVLTVGFLMMEIGAETAVAGIGLWIASIGTIIAVSAGIVQLLISLNTNHTREAVKQVFDSFSSSEGAYNKVYSSDSVMNREFKEIAESIESIAWWKMSWRAIVPLYTSGYRAIDPKTNSENADQTAEIIGQFVRHDVLNVTGLTSSVMSRIRDYKLALQSDADENDDGIPDSQDWVDGTIHADWQPPVNTSVYVV